MNEQLVATITKLVVEKLKDRPKKEQGLIKLRGNNVANMPSSVDRREEIKEQELIPIKQSTHLNAGMSAKTKWLSRNGEAKSDLSDQKQKLEEIRKKTPSRIAVGRAGPRPKTNTWLQFRFDHAAAVDAVYGEVSPSVLDRLGVFSVSTLVKDKEEYIRRPDLGRRLSEEAKQTILEKCEKSPEVQIVISNGLSADAVETNIEDVYLSLKQSLSQLNIQIGTTFYVDKGRVALMDDIGDLLTPEVVIMLIGERPGLVSAESMSAYLCYKPRKGTVEADRMVVSNIHKGGIPPVEAGAYLGTVIQKILKYQASGVALVQKEG